MLKNIFLSSAAIIFNFCLFAQNNATFYFQFDDVSFTKESEQAFKIYEATIPKGAKVSISVSCDSTGTKAYNQNLSERRLQNVIRRLSTDVDIVKKVAIAELEENENLALNRKVLISYLIENKEGINNSSIPTSSKFDERKQEFEKSMTQNESFVLNVQFIGGEANFLNYESFEEVLALADFLKAHPEKRILIRGHVCCSDNMELSINRAFRVYNQLIKEGIDQSRMEYNGFSNKMLLVIPDNTLEANAANRRVDIVFLK